MTLRGSGAVFLLLAAISIWGSVQACEGASLKKGEDRPSELTTLLNMKGSPEATQKKRATSIRIKVLTDTAQTLGFQRGFRWRYEQIYQAADVRSLEFDRIFNFGALLIKNRVLPPVIQWADKAVNIESDDYATSVEAQYRIVRPARIVSTPPSWRGYLMMDLEALEVAPEIYPTSGEENKTWRSSIEKGWQEGVEHACDVFRMNMDQLVAEYRGMLRFKMLTDQGLVSVPTLAEGNLGVQVGENVLNINHKTFRITVPAAFRIVK